MPPRRLLLGGASLLAVLAAATVVLVYPRSWDSSAAAEPAVNELAVEHATLSRGRIVLAVRNGSEEAARIAEVIVNDGFVDFRPHPAAIAVGGRARLEVAFPWVEGESYEVELLTATGATVAYGIDDAQAG